jgi:hypothetical protein
MNFDVHTGTVGQSINVLSLKGDGDVGIGTSVVTKQLDLRKYGESAGIRVGDTHFYSFGSLNNDYKGSPTFRNLNSNAQTVLRVIPNGPAGTSQFEFFANDYYTNLNSWNNFRIVANPLLNYIKLDTASAASGVSKDLVIETNSSSGGSLRNNPNQLYLKTDGNIGINSNSPRYELDIRGSLGVSGAFYDSLGDSGANNEVLLSTVTGTRWGNPADITVGNAATSDTILTTETSSNTNYYLTFVDNTAPDNYENLYINQYISYNPTEGVVIGSDNSIFLGPNPGDNQILAAFRARNDNVSLLQIEEVRDSTGPDWTTAYTRIQKKIDVTNMGYIQFNGTGLNYGIEFGTNGDERFAVFNQNSSVDLYYNDHKNFSTISNGIQIFGSPSNTIEATIKGPELIILEPNSSIISGIATVGIEGNLQPYYGLVDSVGLLGSINQVLVSTGSGIKWSDDASITVDRANYANQIRTQSNAADSFQYLTFVDDNTSSPGSDNILYTDDAIQYNPASNTLKLTNQTATSTSEAALWLSGSSGALLIDDSGHKRLSWNDGGADLALRSNSYYNSGEIIVKF